jgi:hypothetical protein
MTSCAFINENSVAIVNKEPAECELVAYLGQVFSDNRESGVNTLQRDTLREGGNTLYLDPSKQSVVAKIVGGRYLSIGSAYLCAEEI